MLPTVQLGPLALQVPGLLLIAGVWFATTMTEREAPQRGLSPAVLANLIFLALLVGLAGARLGYALRYPNAYLESPLDLLALNPYTLSLPDGLTAAGLAAFAYAVRRKLPLWPTLDALTPGAALFAVFYAAAHLASGDAFGAPSSLPWAVSLWGEMRHPTQVYEILLAAAALAVVLRVRMRTPFPGFLALTWIGLAAASRLLLEAFRGDSLIVLGTLRLAQVVSLAVLLGAMAGLHMLAKRASGVWPDEGPAR